MNGPSRFSNSESQIDVSQVVARDYGMKDARLRVPVRKALLDYFEKRLRLDVAAPLDGPSETPIMIANRDAFGAALVEATS